MELNKITLACPNSIFDALREIKLEIEDFGMIQTAINRCVVPFLGGPVPQEGKHTTLESHNFLKKVPISQLVNISKRIDVYFDQVNAPPAYRSRTRFQLIRLETEMEARGWISSTSPKDKKPHPYRFNRPKGERRLTVADIKTTNRRGLEVYALGRKPEDFIEVGGQPVLANPVFDQQIKQLRAYGVKSRKIDSVETQIKHILEVFGYLHRIGGTPLEELSLEKLIPFVKLRYSYEDFEGHDAFIEDQTGDLLDPIKAEQTLAMREALALRVAKRKAPFTTNKLKDFFGWRQQELAQRGQPEGLSPATKRLVIDSVILAGKAVFQSETDVELYQDFEDIPAVCHLRLFLDQHVVDIKQTQKQVKKRCISFPQAMKVFEAQRLQSIEYFTASHDNTRSRGLIIRHRPETAIANDIQKTCCLGIMLPIPADRQQSYRDLKFGFSLKNGYFEDTEQEDFIDLGIPAKPDEAQYWINLVDFKTVDYHGEFWYPVPNIQFLDRTTFYQYLAAWLWGFEDDDGIWPEYYEGSNSRWQGYIDPQGNRLGWRAALHPSHDYVFTMPNTGEPFYQNAFTSFIRNLFIRHTQDMDKVVPVTPHSLRHMLSTYLEQIKISDIEKKSFAYVLHHSVETHQKHYVHRDNWSKIEPAVKRMNQIIRDLL